MKIYRARLSKETLLKMPSEESQLFLALAHLYNEISYLLRSVLLTSDFSSENDAEVDGQLCLSFWTRVGLSQRFEILGQFQEIGSEIGF